MIMFAMRFIAFCYVGLRCGGGCGGVPFNANTAEIFRHTNHPFIPGQSPPESLIREDPSSLCDSRFPAVANGIQLKQCTLIMRISMIRIQG